MTMGFLTGFIVFTANQGHPSSAPSLPSRSRPYKWSERIGSALNSVKMIDQQDKDAPRGSISLVGPIRLSLIRNRDWDGWIDTGMTGPIPGRTLRTFQVLQQIIEGSMCERVRGGGSMDLGIFPGKYPLPGIFLLLYLWRLYQICC